MDDLETDRLLLRRSRVDDAAVLRRLWTERDARVPAHRRVDSEGRPSVEDVETAIRAGLDRPGPALLTVERKDPGDVVGYCGLVPYDDGAAGECELAFELLRAVHGQGFATEAGRAVVAWAAGAGHARLWATVWDWNTPSRRVLEKLGFRVAGVAGTSAHGESLVTVREL